MQQFDSLDMVEPPGLFTTIVARGLVARGEDTMSRHVNTFRGKTEACLVTCIVICCYAAMG